MEKRWRLVVKPGFNGGIGLLWLLFLIFCLFNIPRKNSEDLGRILLIMCFGVPIVIYFLMSARNKRVVFYDWGIVARNWLGIVSKVRYEEITVIKVWNLRKTIVSFFAGDVLITQCYSGERNFSELLQFLTEYMPEKIEWF